LKAQIYFSLNGAYLGEVEDFDSERYAERCYSPEGHVRADTVLTRKQLDTLEIADGDLIYAL